MERIAEFVQEHLNDDTARLVLDRGKWPGIDMEVAVNCIESRRKLRKKVQEWYEEPGLIFPLKLSAEQCSSSATGRYKAELAARIACSGNTEQPQVHSVPIPFSIADLTGGLGVDSWFFSRMANEVLYNEMQSKLHEAAIHNFKVLNSNNIRCKCIKAEPGRIKAILDGMRPDIVYMDPARRGEGGRKVFLIEDCTPDVLTLQNEIFEETGNILIKLSPMADISMVCERLGRRCREVHVVASGGECRELLIWMDRKWDSDYEIVAVELPGDYPENEAAFFRFMPSEEREADATEGSMGHYLFEPGKAMMKSGAFNLISRRFGINKFGRSTHYYTTDDKMTAAELMKYGKVFEIMNSMPLDKRSIKAAAKECPKAEVTARNIAMDTEALRKKLGTAPSDVYHIFGLKSDKDGSVLLVTKRV